MRTETVATTAAGATSSVRYAFFRTAGPPTDLTPYLGRDDARAPQQAAFQRYDLRFTFNQSYVTAMFADELTIEVVDDDGRPVIAADGGPSMTLGLGASPPSPPTPPPPGAAPDHAGVPARRAALSRRRRPVIAA